LSPHISISAADTEPVHRIRSLRRALALAVTAAGIAALAVVVPSTQAAGAAGLGLHRGTVHTLAPGVQWQRIAWTNEHGPQAAWVMSIDLTHKAIHIRPGMANGHVNDRETVLKIAHQVHALGGINGDLFNWYTWLPYGGVGVKGTVFKTPNPRRPSQFYIRADGHAGIGSLVFTASVKQVNPPGVAEASRVLRAVNTPGSADSGRLTLFTPAVSGLSLNRCSAVSGSMRTGVLTVHRVYTQMSKFNRLRDGHRLLAACGKTGTWLIKHAPLAQKLRIRQHLTTASGKRVQSFLSAQRLIRQHGRAVKDPTGFHTTGINPETGVCVSRDGLHVRFIVADGWMSGNGGRGLTIADLGRFAAALHCYSTIVLDGGGSATMVAHRAGGLAVLNEMPRKIVQRPVPNGLFVVRS
jgi:hypothetical protein